MKKTLVLLTVVLSVLAGLTAKAQQAVLDQRAPTPTTFSIEYTNFNGRPVFMEFNSIDQRISLKIKATPGFIFGGKDHDERQQFLKDEAVRLSSTTNTVALADGYSFKFGGGYPIWAPYFAMEKTGEIHCLMFAKEAAVTADKVIMAKGDASKPLGYYPYPSNKR